MKDFLSLEVGDELLYFWAIGDLHYRAREQWHTMHSRRMAPLFQDLRALWLDGNAPAFCVSPGDIVDTGAPENYKLAKRDLAAQLGGNIPFYPGIGNHEFHAESRMDITHTAEEFSAAWDRPVRYTWTAGEVLCIMLDQPDPYTSDPHKENTQVIFSEDPFFYVENSQEVREILARHANAGLYVSGHTHSGWGSPNLVFTEILGGHPVTHVNLMSPWYTGRRRGPRLSADRLSLEYYPDDPDVLATFAVRVYRHGAIIGVRDHRARQWLAWWTG